jgi:hypothetical protein
MRQHELSIKSTQARIYQAFIVADVTNNVSAMLILPLSNTGGIDKRVYSLNIKSYVDWNTIRDRYGY